MYLNKFVTIKKDSQINDAEGERVGRLVRSNMVEQLHAVMVTLSLSLILSH